MIYFGLKTSLAGGIIVITLLIIPIFIRSMDEIARELPQDLLHASYSLGATRYETIKVVVRQIAPASPPPPCCPSAVPSAMPQP